ncbi:MAG: phosphotransferase [Myxococcales bacterium]|nr:phosphotransferase [Myxococcales bacterium]
MKDILARFPIGAVHAVTPVRSGLMHQTQIVDADRGRYVLQRLHPKLSTAEIIGDYAAVTAHLAARALPAPRLVPTTDGEPVAVDDEGLWWRLAPYVEGETREKVTSTAQAEQGARMLGRFHRAMADIEHVFASQHPLHDTEGHLARLRDAAINPRHASICPRVADEIAAVFERLPPLLLPADLPRRVVHGDPKISNVLFRGEEAVGLIDLDTCNVHTVLVDLGDAVRSWCRDGAEDEAQRFHVDRFEAILRGYAAEGPKLTPAERAHLGGAGRLITLELASRFARDVLEDEYFGYDADRYADRRSHNLARARGMLFLAADMQAHREQIEQLVVQYFGA